MTKRRKFTTIENITNAQVMDLLTEANRLGDTELAEVCDRALQHDLVSLSKCVAEINRAEAEALADEEKKK